MSSGRFKLSKTNNDVFTDSFANDLILQADNQLQRILIGLGCNVHSTIGITSNSISISNMVGIGTTNPLEVLDVRGNARISSNQYVYGNVGIGTTNTLGNQLYIVGNTQTTGTFTASNIYIQGDMTIMGTQTVLNTDVSLTDQFVISNAGSDTALKVYQYGLQNTFETYYNDKLSLIVGNNGFVGIGTSTPNDTFEVYGNSLFSGNTTVNCNLNVTKITNLTDTLNCLSNVNITGTANYNSNLIVEGIINCHSNVNITSNLYCPTINNIVLNYDVPNVIITNSSVNTRYIQYTLSNIKQDNDGFGNLIPHIDKLYVTYSNNTLGSNIIVGSNNIQNIKYLNIYSGSNSLNYTTTSTTNDTMNIYGLVSASNYTVSMYYQNYRGNSPSNTVINNVLTTTMGPPTIVQNLTLTTDTSNLYINFNSPLYSDSINNQNVASISSYYMDYSACSSIKFGGVIHSNNYISNTNKFTISNYTTELYSGTLYKFQVYSKNDNLNSNSSIASNYFYTGFDSNKYPIGCNLNSLTFADGNTSYYNFNTYYAIDCGSNGPVTSFISSSSNQTRLMNNSNLFYKYTTTSNLNLFYQPNPQNSNYVGTITGQLNIVTKTVNSNLETLIMNIKPFNSNNESSINNSKYLGLRLSNLNNSNNYFLYSGLEVSINYSSKASNASYNQYNLTTTVNLNNYPGWSTTDTSNLTFNSNILSTINEGSSNFIYYYDNLSNIGLPKVAGFNYTLSNNSQIYISGIPSSSNYSLNYNVTLSNVGNYWVVNPMIKITDINSISSFYKEITTSNNYYYQYQPIYSYLFYDMSTNNRTLTGNLPIYSSNTPYSNIENYSLDFNNVSQKTVVINNINDGVYGNWNRNYTINVWLYLCEYPSQTSLLFLNSPVTYNTNYNNGSISITTTGKIEYNCWLGNVNTSITSLGLNTWNYITLIWTSTNNSTFIYINGMLDSTKTNISVNYWGLGYFLFNYNLPSNKFLMNDFRYSFNIKSTAIPTSPLTIDSDTFLLLKYDKLTTNPYTNYNYTLGLNNNVLLNLDKATLSNGLSTYSNNLIFNETDNFIVNSNVLYSKLDYNIIGYSILNSNTSNVSVGFFQNDLNSINHPHISINSSSNIYGKRVFANCSNITDYPTINLIDTYNNSSNIGYSNYAKEAVLYNGYYYGNYTSNWKNNWTSIDSNSFNYSNITSNNVRWCTTLFTNIMGSSTNLQVNINSNSHDDKLLYVKYYSDELIYESPWFNSSNNFNGKSLYVNRTNNDGIKDNSKIDTINKKNIKCPPLDYLSVYVGIGIPYSNLNSCFSTVNITT